MSAGSSTTDVRLPGHFVQCLGIGGEQVALGHGGGDRLIPLVGVGAGMEGGLSRRRPPPAVR
jgi:hypothetical protein